MPVLTPTRGLPKLTPGAILPRVSTFNLMQGVGPTNPEMAMSFANGVKMSFSVQYGFPCCILESMKPDNCFRYPSHRKGPSVLTIGVGIVDSLEKACEAVDENPPGSKILHVPVKGREFGGLFHFRLGPAGIAVRAKAGPLFSNVATCSVMPMADVFELLCYFAIGKVLFNFSELRRARPFFLVLPLAITGAQIKLNKYPGSLALNTS